MAEHLLNSFDVGSAELASKVAVWINSGGITGDDDPVRYADLFVTDLDVVASRLDEACREALRESA